MNGQNRAAIRIGARVNIVLKANQRSGKLTEGIVAKLLMKSASHPRGIKVMMEDGKSGGCSKFWNKETETMSMNNPQQLLRDANIAPTAEIIADGLRAANAVYVKFIGDLQKYSISLMDWRFYNDGKAWLSKGEYKWITARGTNKVKPIFWLSIWEEAFRVSFLFSENIRAELLLPISEATKEMIRNTKPNGKTMKYLPVIFDITNDSQLDDVYVLAEFRKENI